MSKSLASGKTDYADIQISVRGGGILHVQGKGTNQNRQYGVSDNIDSGKVTNFNENTDITSSLFEYVSGMEKPLTSFAGTGVKYIAAQASIRGDRVHVQISGPKNNRSYGAAFDVTSESVPQLSAFITKNVTGSADEYEEEYDDDYNDDDSDSECNDTCCNDSDDTDETWVPFNGTLRFTNGVAEILI